MPLRYGFLSTFPPTQCGLATFTAALREHLSGAASGVVRLLDAPVGPSAPLAPPRPALPPQHPHPRQQQQQQPPQPSPPSIRPIPAGVVGDLVAGVPGGPERAARLLDSFDVAVVQHEYGVYGGQDGDEVIDVMRRLHVPMIVVLHTVLVEPTRHQREILEAVVELADAIVVMTETARARLVAGYRVDPRRVDVIPHGAADVGGPTLAGNRRPTVLTWGLIGPGKGVEWGIAAMAHLADLDPAPRYLVVGQTHPKVVARQGEAYRDGLVAQARQLGVDGSVAFDGRYLRLAELGALVRGADVVLLPYDSRDQVTSGVLIEAVAARKPIVATRFPHAVELLGDGAGLLVPHRDPPAIADAVRSIVTDDRLTSALARAAAARAPELLWPAVADRYRRLANRLVDDARATAATAATQAGRAAAGTRLAAVAAR